jgi:hypothetical protein
VLPGEPGGPGRDERGQPEAGAEARVPDLGREWCQTPGEGGVRLEPVADLGLEAVVDLQRLELTSIGGERPRVAPDLRRADPGEEVVPGAPARADLARHGRAHLGARALGPGRDAVAPGGVQSDPEPLRGEALAGRQGQVLGGAARPQRVDPAPAVLERDVPERRAVREEAERHARLAVRAEAGHPVRDVKAAPRGRREGAEVHPADHAGSRPGVVAARTTQWQPAGRRPRLVAHAVEAQRRRVARQRQAAGAAERLERSQPDRDVRPVADRERRDDARPLLAQLEVELEVQAGVGARVQAQACRAAERGVDLLDAVEDRRAAE